jgi:hypothetical protein
MQNMTPNHAQGQTGFIPPGNTSFGQEQPLHADTNAALQGNQHPFFYTRDQDDDLNIPLPQVDPQEQSSPFVLPFQSSAGMSMLSQVPAQGQEGAMGTPPGASPPGNTSRKSLRTIRILLIVGVVLTVVLGASLFVFAQSLPSPRRAQANKMQTIRTAGTPMASTTTPARHAVAKAHASSRSQQGARATGTTSSSSIPSGQTLNQLGWTQAGLSEGDAIEALRTGATFTEREMSYDYRDIGTPAQHSGTLTAATFLLTRGGLARFTNNDVRVINNVLYDRISTDKIIQQVVNAAPSLVQFQTEEVQGESHQFAWVNVAFLLFQSRLNPANGKRMEGLEPNPATGQPMIHHMIVVLVRVPPQTQGANAPMGGTGWLVNTYELDPGVLPAVVTTPSL